MINDYNSFITGVIIGLKLGRTKLGRQPPAPSGRYILTESGEHVITEKTIDWDGITIFETDVWYTLEYPDGAYTKVQYQTLAADYPNAGDRTPIKSYIFYRDLGGLAPSRYYPWGSVTFSYDMDLPETPSHLYPGQASVQHRVSLMDADGNQITSTHWVWAYYGFGDVAYWPRNGIPKDPYETDVDFYVGNYNEDNEELELWFPAGITKVFEGTNEDLYNLFANKKYIPMITEGG